MSTRLLAFISAGLILTGCGHDAGRSTYLASPVGPTAGGGSGSVPPSAKHMDTVLHVLNRLQPARAGQLAPPLKKLAEHFSRRGLLVVAQRTGLCCLARYCHQPGVRRRRQQRRDLYQ